MLSNEPGLQFVRSKNIADNKVVRALIASFIRLLRDIQAALNNDLVGLEQPRDLYRNLFPAARRTLYPGNLGNITAHGNRNAAKELNPFCNGIDHLDLLTEVLIK